MSSLIKNIYITSSRYLFCLSESVLLWIFALIGQIFGIVFSSGSQKIKSKQVTHNNINNKLDKMNKLSLNDGPGLEKQLKQQKQKKQKKCDPSGGNDQLETDKDNDGSFDGQKCQSWFESNVIHSEDPNEMNEEDVIQFVQDIDKNLEDVVLLVLAYKMNAAKAGFFTQEEWMRGMSALKIDSSSTLVDKWEWIRSLLDEKAFFRSVYRFSFKFSRSQERRNLEMDLCQGLIQIFFENRWSLVSDFIEFLKSTNYPVLTNDEFCSVYEFQEHIDVDLENYDFEGAWPILFDDFVVYMREKSKKAKDSQIAEDKNGNLTSTTEADYRRQH